MFIIIVVLSVCFKLCCHLKVYIFGFITPRLINGDDYCDTFWKTTRNNINQLLVEIDTKRNGMFYGIFKWFKLLFY